MVAVNLLGDRLGWECTFLGAVRAFLVRIFCSGFLRFSQLDSFRGAIRDAKAVGSPAFDDRIGIDACRAGRAAELPAVRKNQNLFEHVALVRPRVGGLLASPISAGCTSRSYLRSKVCTCWSPSAQYRRRRPAGG